MTKSSGLFIISIAGIALTVAAAYWFFLRPAQLPPKEPPPANPIAQAPTLIQPQGVLRDAKGVVEISVRSEAWQPAKPGMELSDGTALRTGRASTASVEYSSSIKLDIRADTEVRVERFDADVAKFVLGKEGGLVVLDVAEDNRRRVQLAAEGSDAIAETRSGRVHMLSDGTGNVQTAITRGEATFMANKKVVRMKAGQTSRARRGKRPTTPQAIPGSLFLKVRWPETETAKRRHLITGTASPGARVRVVDMVITADSRGRFQALVELKEGENRVGILAVDILGRTKKLTSPAIVLDTRAPAHRIETGPNMWKQQPRTSQKPEP